jgi:hypothetical protein
MLKGLTISNPIEVESAQNMGGKPTSLALGFDRERLARLTNFWKTLYFVRIRIQTQHQSRTLRLHKNGYIPVAILTSVAVLKIVMRYFHEE